MKTLNILTITYIILIGIVVLFQLALAAGKPWGEFAMGGKYPGKLPKQMRIAVFIQALILVFIGLIILIRSGMILNELYNFSETAIWFIIGFNLLATVLNLITPSKKERMVWGPVSFMMLILSLILVIFY